MNRLKTILLAGTIVPPLVLTPFTAAFSQAPEQQNREPGRSESGGPRGAPAGGAHNGPRAGGAMRGEAGRKGEAGPRGPAGAAERTPKEPRQPGGMKAEKAAPAERTTPATKAERTTPPAGTDRSRAEKSRDGAAEKSNADAVPAQADKQNGKQSREKNGRGGRNGGPDNATRNDRMRNEGANDGTQKNGMRNEKQDDRMHNGTPNEGQNDRMNRNGMRNERQDDRMQRNRMPNEGQNDRMQRNGMRDEGRDRIKNDAGRDDGGPDERMQNSERRLDNGQNRDSRNDLNRGERGRVGPGGAAAIGAAVGFGGGFLAATGARRLDEIRHDRRETVEDGRTYIREPGRTIIQDGGRAYIIHDENDRFRQLGYEVRRERRGKDFVDVVDRPGGEQILTFTTPDGRMLRRVRRSRDGREVVLIDNGYDGRVRPIQDDVVVLPPPPIRIPRDRYAVDYRDADESLIYDTLVAPPVATPPRRYTLDQIRYSPDVRNYMRSVDINTINFDSGSWIVPGEATGKLQALAGAIKKAVDRNPNAVFLVEGFTDATGNPTDNLSLSDRRAQSVAAILTKDFNVPPENLTTQGYGQQSPKENTQGPSAANRRVVVQNITPLLAAGGPAPR